jgi:hypothetical protein
MATQIPIGTQWFIQDGAMPPTANVVLDFLNTIFSHFVMSHRFQSITIADIFGCHLAQT